MARKNLQSPDSRHVQFGEVDTFSNPPGFTAPDDGAFCSGYAGREMENDGDGAYIENEVYPESEEQD
jgi:hypothetical protein